MPPPIHPSMPVFPLCPSGATPPKYLDGTMLGDYGFDPLRLGSKDKASGCWVLPLQRGVVCRDGHGSQTAVPAVLHASR